MNEHDRATAEGGDTAEGYASIKCPQCSAEMGLYESTDFDGTESLWWGMCPECGAEVEGWRWTKGLISCC